MRLVPVAAWLLIIEGAVALVQIAIYHAGFTGPRAMALGIGSALVGTIRITTGVGLLNRKIWARILGMIISALAIILGSLSLISDVRFAGLLSLLTFSLPFLAAHVFEFWVLTFATQPSDYKK
jgi:hypothetical protein